MDPLTELREIWPKEVEMEQKLARSLGLGSGLVEKTVNILAGLAVASLAKKAATHEGAVITLASLPQEPQPSLIPSLLSALKGTPPEQTPADRLHALFGPGVNSMLAALTRRLGFDVARLAAMVAPLMAQQLAKEVREEGLDASAFARKLQQSWDSFLKDPDPANAGTLTIVRETLAIGDQALTLRAQFTEAELEAIHLAPQAAYWLVAQASLSGIRGTIREIKAASQVATDLVKTVPPLSLMALVFGGGSGLSAAEEEELFEDTRNQEDLLDNIRTASAVIAAKVPDELEIFRALIRDVARKTAEASKEGGFLGIGGVLVSDKEKQAMALVESAL